MRLLDARLKLMYLNFTISIFDIPFCGRSLFLFLDCLLRTPSIRRRLGTNSFSLRDTAVWELRGQAFVKDPLSQQHGQESGQWVLRFTNVKLCFVIIVSLFGSISPGFAVVSLLPHFVIRTLYAKAVVEIL